MIYYVQTGKHCNRRVVEASKSGSKSSYENHAALWNGNFDKMHYFYEDHYDCASGDNVKVKEKTSEGDVTVVECASGYEAHVVHWVA